MKNFDKIKNSIGETLFNYIATLDTEELQKMKLAIDKDINRFFDTYDYESQQRRLDEQWLINYRLS